MLHVCAPLWLHQGCQQEKFGWPGTLSLGLLLSGCCPRQFTYGSTPKYEGPKTASCIPASGTIPNSTVKVAWESTFKFAPSECLLCRQPVPMRQWAVGFGAGSPPGHCCLCGGDLPQMHARIAVNHTGWPETVAQTHQVEVRQARLKQQSSPMCRPLHPPACLSAVQILRRPALAAANNSPGKRLCLQAHTPMRRATPLLTQQ